MPTVDITQQPTVVEVQNDTSVVAFTESSVTVEVPTPAPVVEFSSAATLVPGTGLVGGGYMLGNVPIGLSPASIASLAKADTAVQPGGNLSQLVDDVGYATDAEVFALLSGLGGSFQPLNEQLTSIGALSTTAFGRSFLTLANEAAARTLIGVYSTSEVLSLLSAKANASHTHTTADITGGISWSNLTGVPATFPPGAHTHVKADITNFAHTHLLAEITDYVAPVLAHSGLTGLAADDHTQYHTDARGDARYSALGHTHDARYYTEGEVDTLLTGLAVSGHTHTFASLTSKPTTLVGYGITDAADSAHTHTFASLTSKPTTLAGYGITDASASGHTHSYLSDAPSDGNQYARKNGAWDVVSAGGAYLPLVGGTLTGITNIRNAADTTLNRHFELTQSEGTAVRPIYQMFHQENRWYNRIKVENTGFSFVQGATEDYVNIAAAIVTGTILQSANFLSPLGYGGANTANSFYNDGYGTMKFGQASTAATNVPEAPDNANFMISYESHAGGYGRQFYYPDNHNNWFRLHQSGTWGTWHKMARHEGAGYLLANTHDVWSASGWGRALALRTSVGSCAIQLYNSTRHWGLGASGGIFYLMHTTSDTSAAPGMTYPMYCDAATMTLAVHLTVGGNITANNLTSYYNITLGSGYGLYLNPSLYIADRSSNTYGSIRVSGSKNNYSGIFFDSSYQANGLMFNNGSNEFGLYSESGGWKFYYTGTTFHVQGGAYKPMPWHDMGGTAASARYSRGTIAPSGGSDGDVYFQYT